MLARVQKLRVSTSRLCSLNGDSGPEDSSSPPPRPRPLRPRQPLIVSFLSPQAADSSAWWTGAVPAPGEWRSLTRAPGAPSAITAGTWKMPTWSADSWAVEKPSMPLALLPLGRDQGPFGWTTWSAQEKSPTCGGALPGAGGSTTVITARMQESSAQVWSVHAHQLGEGKVPRKLVSDQRDSRGRVG